MIATDFNINFKELHTSKMLNTLKHRNEDGERKKAYHKIYVCGRRYGTAEKWLAAAFDIQHKNIHTFDSNDHESKVVKSEYITCWQPCMRIERLLPIVWWSFLLFLILLFYGKSSSGE